MTFREYLRSRKPKSDSVGDLVRLSASADFPNAGTLAEIRSLIVAKYGEGPVSDAAATGWKDYEAALKKLPT